MKLVRFGNPGAEKPGLTDRDGGIRDLSGHIVVVAWFPKAFTGG